MQNSYGNFTNLRKENLDDAVDLMKNNFMEANEYHLNLLLCESTNYKNSSFFTYLTPFGYVPIVHIYKNDLKKFIENIENNYNTEINFISDPLYNSIYPPYDLDNVPSCNSNSDPLCYLHNYPLCDLHNDPKCCSKWIYKNNKFYFMEYEDGHSAFCAYYVNMTNDLVDKLKIIYNKIPDNIDNLL